jgi:hypothetical protein
MFAIVFNTIMNLLFERIGFFQLVMQLTRVFIMLIKGKTILTILSTLFLINSLVLYTIKPLYHV